MYEWQSPHTGDASQNLTKGNAIGGQFLAFTQHWIATCVLFTLNCMIGGLLWALASSAEYPTLHHIPALALLRGEACCSAKTSHHVAIQETRIERCSNSN